MINEKDMNKLLEDLKEVKGYGTDKKELKEILKISDKEELIKQLEEQAKAWDRIAEDPVVEKSYGRYVDVMDVVEDIENIIKKLKKVKGEQMMEKIEASKSQLNKMANEVYGEKGSVVEDYESKGFYHILNGKDTMFSGDMDKVKTFLEKEIKEPVKASMRGKIKALLSEGYNNEDVVKIMSSVSVTLSSLKKIVNSFKKYKDGADIIHPVGLIADANTNLFNFGVVTEDTLRNDTNIDFNNLDNDEEDDADKEYEKAVKAILNSNKGSFSAAFGYPLSPLKYDAESGGPYGGGGMVGVTGFGCKGILSDLNDAESIIENNKKDDDMTGTQKAKAMKVLHRLQKIDWVKVKVACKSSSGEIKTKVKEIVIKYNKIAKENKK